MVLGQDFHGNHGFKPLLHIHLAGGSNKLSLFVATVPWDSVATSRIMASKTEVQNGKVDSLPRHVK